MKAIFLLVALAMPLFASAEPMDYVEFSLNLAAVKALKTVYPECAKPKVSSKVVEGITHFTIQQSCKVSTETADDAPNDSVVLTITGHSAPWGEIDGVVVKVGAFCAGNCEI